MSDFGGLIRGTPALTLQAHGDAEVLEGFACARQSGLSLTTRGAGHSVHGQSISQAGISLQTYERDVNAVWRDDEVVEVSAFASWRAVEAELNRRGRSMPVLTDYLDLSVGGTLSVGGIGLNSVVCGMQLDHVRACSVLTPQRGLVCCSRQVHADLFRFVLGGLGQMGVIMRVQLQTSALRSEGHMWTRTHGTAVELVDWIAELAQHADVGGGVDHYNGYIHGSQIVSEFGTLQAPGEQASATARELVAADDSFRRWSDFPLAMQGRRERWLNDYPDTLKLWTDYVLPIEAAREFAQELPQLLGAGPLSQLVKAVYVLAIRRGRDAFEFPFAPASTAPLQVGFGFYTMVHAYRPLDLARCASALRGVLDRCASLGGRPYLYGYVPMDDALRERFYGPALEQWSSLREQYCGEVVLNPRAFGGS